MRYLLPAAALITLAGYFGPWVGHRAAGLVIPGLDLGEYVKFLPVVRSGEVHVWREGFYLPLCTVSLALSLHAFRSEFRYHWLAKAALLGVAIVAALNMLPPAWSPGLLRTGEFRLQTAAIAICLAAVLTSPFLGLLPSIITGSIVIVLAAASAWFPVSGFLAVLANIEALYNNPIRPGWGMWLMLAGLALTIVTMWMAHFARHEQKSSDGAAVQTAVE